MISWARCSFCFLAGYMKGCARWPFQSVKYVTGGIPAGSSLSAPRIPVPYSTYNAYSVFATTFASTVSPSIFGDRARIRFRRSPVSTGTSFRASFATSFAALPTPTAAAGSTSASVMPRASAISSSPSTVISNSIRPTLPLGQPFNMRYRMPCPGLG